jgi:hypothetical protein
MVRADFEEEEDGGGDLGLASASASEEAGGCRAVVVVAFPPPLDCVYEWATAALLLGASTKLAMAGDPRGGVHRD